MRNDTDDKISRQEHEQPNIPWLTVIEESEHNEDVTDVCF